MNKLITANAKLFLICVALQLVCAGPTEAQSKDSLKLGSQDHVVYIDVTKLPTKLKFEYGDIHRQYLPKRSAQSFYHKWAWGRDNCPAGSLREGVIASCLPFVRLGHYIPQPHHQEPDRFVGGQMGIVVWYEPDRDRFYLWNTLWGLSNVVGPFDGNPKRALKQAIKPRKGERHFPGVNLSFVSQRWLYPDERQALVPPGSGVHSDCSMDAPCARDIEQQNLNTFITRFRLVNDTRKKIYYLGDLNRDDPIGCTLPEFVKRTDRDRLFERDRIRDRLN